MTKKFVYIVSDFYKNGSLCDLLEKKGRIEEKEALRILLQIVNGLAYLHSKNIVHRDLKPQNIFLNDEMNIAIGDFGFGRTLLNHSKITYKCGTYSYLPPEIICNEKVDPKKSDMWGIGMIFYVMLSRQTPWVSEQKEEMLREILYCQPFFPNYFSHHVKHILSSLFQRIPESRLTAEELKTEIEQILFRQYSCKLVYPSPLNHKMKRFVWNPKKVCSTRPKPTQIQFIKPKVLQNTTSYALSRLPKLDNSE